MKINKIVNFLIVLTLLGFISCADDSTDLSGEWIAQEFSRVCIDPTDDLVTSFTDGCYTSAFENTYCYSITLTESTGTYFRTENGESQDDLYVSYTIDETDQSIQMTIDGVPRNGIFQDNTIMFTGTDDGCELSERWVRK